MTNVTPELISVYVDGAATPEQAAQVESAVASDPQAAQVLDELQNLQDLFCPAGTEDVPDDLRDSLYQLGLTAPLEEFVAVKVEAAPARSWGRWAAAIAALVLVAVGAQRMFYRPEVVVRDFTRQLVDARGNVLKTERLSEVKMRAGEALSAKTGERISCRLPGGAMVVLLAGARIELGDPRDREIFELDAGTALCTVPEQEEPRFVHAAGYTISVDRAHFGVRVREAGVRPAGPAMAATADSEVTVGVMRGSLQIRSNGSKETVRAGKRLVWRKGAPAVHSLLWKDPIHVHLMRNFRVLGREILPGFFSVETGVTSIPAEHWLKGDDGGRQLVLTGSRRAYASHHLVLYARAHKPTALEITRVMPDAKRPGVAEASTVRTAQVGTAWTVVSIARKAFDSPRAERKDRKIPVGRSRLTRLEIRPADSGVKFELKASLWAARPPADLSEVVK